MAMPLRLGSPVLTRPPKGLWAHIHVPPPVPPGPYGPPEDPPVTVPTPEGTPPEIDEPVPEPMLPIREPGVIRPPQAARPFLSRRLH